MKKINEVRISSRNDDVISSDSYNAAVSVMSENSIAVATGTYGAASAAGSMCIAIASGLKGAATALSSKSLAIGWGTDAKVKGVLGSSIAIGYIEPSGLHIELRKVDGREIQPDTWYSIANGTFTKTI